MIPIYPIQFVKILKNETATRATSCFCFVPGVIVWMSVFNGWVKTKAICANVYVNYNAFVSSLLMNRILILHLLTSCINSLLQPAISISYCLCHFSIAIMNLWNVILDNCSSKWWTTVIVWCQLLRCVNEVITFVTLICIIWWWYRWKWL